MAENKNIQANKQIDSITSEKKRQKSFRLMPSILGGNFLNREGSFRIFPYILFLAFLAVLYIANIFYAEKNIRDLDATNREIKELRYEYITNKSNLMHLSKQSELVKKLKKQGIKEAVIPPFKLKSNNND